MTNCQLCGGRMQGGIIYDTQGKKKLLLFCTTSGCPGTTCTEVKADG